MRKVAVLTAAITLGLAASAGVPRGGRAAPLASEAFAAGVPARYLAGENDSYKRPARNLAGENDSYKRPVRYLAGENDTPKRPQMSRSEGSIAERPRRDAVSFT